MLTIEQIQKVINDCELSRINTNNETTLIRGNFLDIKNGNNPYHHSSIYKIVSDNTDKIYIGSTYLSLKERLRLHVKDFKRFQNGKKSFVTSSNILEYGNFRIELIESVCVETEFELLKIEGFHQMKNPNIVNKHIDQ